MRRKTSQSLHPQAFLFSGSMQRSCVEPAVSLLGAAGSFFIARDCLVFRKA